jgi:acetyl-CoA decarbonylase/synthase complex subunit gamma
MALTALDIFKLLPKTNCGDCGVPTCLAFAMKLANKQAELNACPHVSDDATNALEASAAPPMRLVKIGTGDNEFQSGGETELFRHDKKFYHHTAYAVMVDDAWDAGEIETRVEEANGMAFERVGQEMKLELIAVKSTSGNQETFAKAVETVKGKSKLPLILISDNPDVLEAGLKLVAGDKPLLHAATSDNWEAMANLAKTNEVGLTVTASTIDDLADLTQKVKGAGVEDIVIDFGPKNLGETLQMATIIRRLALKKNMRSLGYPLLMVMDPAGDPEDEGIKIAFSTMKYGGIVIMNDISRWKMYPLFTLRQNIYTDPQVPIQVKPELYEINNPDDTAPLMFTTNFSLTYFTVQSDIEASKVPAFLQVVDTEGLSVMTSFAADKLTPKMVVEALEKTGAKDKIKHNKIIIPGMVSRMSGKLEEESGMNIEVGPRDSAALPKFLKEWKSD